MIFFMGCVCPVCLCAAWRIAVPKITLELAVGDVLRIGNRILTVLDIEGTDVHFRLEEPPSETQSAAVLEDVLTPSPERLAFRAKAK